MNEKTANIFHYVVIFLRDHNNIQEELKKQKLVSKDS